MIVALLGMYETVLDKYQRDNKQICQHKDKEIQGVEKTISGTAFLSPMFKISNEGSSNTIRIIYNPLTSHPLPPHPSTPAPPWPQTGILLVFKSSVQFSLNFNRISSTGSIKEENQVQIDLEALQQLAFLLIFHPSIKWCIFYQSSKRNLIFETRP